MDLLGRAKKWMAGGDAAVTSEPQYYRVACPEGHDLQGRRTEGYQAIRCPTCGAGVFILPRSPLPEPPVPADARVAYATGGGMTADDAPIPLSDHVPDLPPEAEDDEQIQWLEPAEVEVVEDEEASLPAGSIDPVDAAISELPEEAPIPAPPGRERLRPKPERARPVPVPEPDEPGIVVADRPTFGDRLRRNRPALVAVGVVVVLLGTVAYTIQRNLRRDYPGLARRGLNEGIAALDRGEFDRAHQLLAPAAAAVDALGGQIEGAAEIRQAAREAAIYVDLVPEPLETILSERAGTVDPDEWNTRFDREYRGRSVLIEALVIAQASTGENALNYEILARGTTDPRRGRIDFEGFGLYERNPPEPGSHVIFGARLRAVEPGDGGSWRFLLEPESGVPMAHQEAIQALGWVPVETAGPRLAARRSRPQGPIPDPLAILTGLVIAPTQFGASEAPEQGEEPRDPNSLRNLPPDEVRRLLGVPRSYARTASQGRFLEQWIYDAPGRGRRYVNFQKDSGGVGGGFVAAQFDLP